MPKPIARPPLVKPKSAPAKPPVIVESDHEEDDDHPSGDDEEPSPSQLAQSPSSSLLPVISDETSIVAVSSLQPSFSLPPPPPSAASAEVKKSTLPAEFVPDHIPPEKLYQDKLFSTGSSVSSRKKAPLTELNAQISIANIGATAVLQLDDTRFKPPTSANLPPNAHVGEFSKHINIKEGQSMAKSSAVKKLPKRFKEQQAQLSTPIPPPVAQEKKKFIAAAQVKVDTQGNILLDYQSLISAPKQDAVTPQGLEEARFQITSASFSKSRPINFNKAWSAEDTKEFYNGLRQCGTDFTLLACLLKGRSKPQIKRKYQVELRENPTLVRAALDPHVSIPLDVDRIEQGQAAGVTATMSADGQEEVAEIDRLVEDGAGKPASAAASFSSGNKRVKKIAAKASTSTKRTNTAAAAALQPVFVPSTQATTTKVPEFIPAPVVVVGGKRKVQAMPPKVAIRIKMDDVHKS